MTIYRQMILNRTMMKLMDEFLSQPSQDELFSPKGLEYLIKAGREAKRKNSSTEPEQILTRRKENESKEN